MEITVGLVVTRRVFPRYSLGEAKMPTLCLTPKFKDVPEPKRFPSRGSTDLSKLVVGQPVSTTNGSFSPSSNWTGTISQLPRPASLFMVMLAGRPVREG